MLALPPEVIPIIGISKPNVSSPARVSTICVKITGVPSLIGFPSVSVTCAVINDIEIPSAVICPGSAVTSSIEAPEVKNGISNSLLAMPDVVRTLATPAVLPLRSTAVAMPPEFVVVAAGWIVPNVVEKFTVMPLPRWFPYLSSKRAVILVVWKLSAGS